LTGDVKLIVRTYVAAEENIDYSLMESFIEKWKPGRLANERRWLSDEDMLLSERSISGT